MQCGQSHGGGQGGIVEADDGDVLRYPPPVLTQAIQHGCGHFIILKTEGGDAGGGVQYGVQCRVAFAKTALNAQGR